MDFLRVIYPRARSIPSPQESCLPGEINSPKSHPHLERPLKSSFFIQEELKRCLPSLGSHAGQNVRNDIVSEPGDGDTCDNINKWVLLIEIVFEIKNKNAEGEIRKQKQPS